MSKTFIDLVEGAALARNDPQVARPYLEEAHRRIEAGEVQVASYPGGKPSLKAVYELAVRIAAEASPGN